MRDLENGRQAAEGRVQQLQSELEDANQKLKAAQENADSHVEELASLQRLLRDRATQLASSKQEIRQLIKVATGHRSRIGMVDRTTDTVFSAV